MSDPALALPGTSASRLEAIWLAELQELARVVAHEINNLLNGVAVNLEVVRTRTERRADATAIVPFTNAALTQLEELTPVVQAMIGLVREPREPVDLAGELTLIARLLKPVAIVRGGALEAGELEHTAPTCVSGATARLLLASSIRRAAGSGSRIRYSASTDGHSSTTIVRLERIGEPVNGVSLDLNLIPELLDVAADAGVSIDRTADSLVLRFPLKLNEPHDTPSHK